MNGVKKIISVMAESFPYEIFWNDPRPEISWDTPDGLWVGHWKYGWYDQIGNEVVKLSDEFEYEVWQPDLRADRIYTYLYNENLSHKLFPAKLKRKTYGLKKFSYASSEMIVENLISESRINKIIIHLDGLNHGVCREILHLDLECPVVVQFLGEVRFPLDNLFKFKKNLLAKFNDVSEHFILKKLFNKISMAVPINEQSQNNLRKYFNKEQTMLSIGIDFNHWKPRTDKRSIRESLGLKNGSYILLSSSRLNGLKQVDKVIAVLTAIEKNFDFQYIVTGHGDQQYEQYLARLGETLVRKGKLKLVGYLSEEKLIDYYNAADLFVITSLSEGAPVASIKAAAMGIPIFSTRTGLLAELLSKHNAGVVVSIKDYKNWETEFKEILNGRDIRVLDKDVARSFFHWPNVAARYLMMFKGLYNDYYNG